MNRGRGKEGRRKGEKEGRNEERELGEKGRGREGEMEGGRKEKKKEKKRRRDVKRKKKIVQKMCISILRLQKRLFYRSQQYKQMTLLM